MRLHSILAAAAAAFMFASAAPAVVVYTFTSTATNPGTFQVTTASFITVDTTFTPAQLDDCSSAVPGFTCGDQLFDVAPSFFGDFDRVEFVTTDGNGTATTQFRFDPGIFGAFGTYNTVSGNAGVLEVSRTGRTPAVPEPATWALLIVGFGVVGAMLRARRGSISLAAL